MQLSDFIHFFNNPRVIIICVFVILFVLFLSEGLLEGFSNNFFSFGPSTDNDGKPVTFMGIKLNSWKNVVITYLILLITTIMEIYYNISTDKLHKIIDYSTILNNIIPLPKLWTYVYFIFQPFITILIYIIRFYATATLQIQYIIPQLIGSYIVNIPFMLHWLKGKEFI
jgi:hypothetical protein